MAEKSFDFFQKTIDYIEERIKEPLTLDDLSNYTNISKFHLIRTFKGITKLAPVEYIRRRKLTSSIHEILNTDLKIIDISNEYGFNYEQSYIRAFKSVFNVSPDKFRREKFALEITDKYDMSRSKMIGEDGIIIVPRFVIKPCFKIVGIRYYINAAENLSSHILTKYAVDFYYNHKQRIPQQKHKNIYWGHVNFKDCEPENSYYTTSVEVSSSKDVPSGMVCETIPTRKYAVFKYIGFHNVEDLTFSQIMGIKQYIYLEWSKTSNYYISDEFHFEKVNMEIAREGYCEMDIYIPISDKNLSSPKFSIP